MTDATSLAPRAYVPLRLSGRPLTLKVAVVVLGTLFLAASSWVAVPMYPVPMTMQTLAVLMVGAFCGRRLGAITVLAWLAEALIGIPVLAEGKVGFAVFAGTTGGYLISFPIIAFIAGWMAERSWTTKMAPSFVTMLIGHIVCFAFGVSWLAVLIGLDKAVAFGLTPFLVGTLVKCALGTAVIAAAQRTIRT